VARLQIILLSFIFVHLTIFSAVAAEGDDEQVAADTEMVDGDNSESRMIRVTSPVIGYQPLTVAGQEIAATYMEETLGERHGAIIFFHDQGEQFESQGVVTPLRHALLKHGWSTLTLQLDYPFETNILLSPSMEQASDEMSSSTDKDSSEPKTDAVDIGGDISKEMGSTDALPPVSNKQRIDAAIALLQAKDIKQIIFLGHGKGGEIAVELLDSIVPPISALILAGTPALPSDQIFATFSFPILDIYGDLEPAMIISAIKHRKIVMKQKGNEQYAMREILGANHLFYGLQTPLELTVRDWLKKSFLIQEAN